MIIASSPLWFMIIARSLEQCVTAERGSRNAVNKSCYILVQLNADEWLCSLLAATWKEGPTWSDKASTSHLHCGML